MYVHHVHTCTRLTVRDPVGIAALQSPCVHIHTRICVARSSFLPPSTHIMFVLRHASRTCVSSRVVMRFDDDSLPWCARPRPRATQGKRQSSAASGRSTQGRGRIGCAHVAYDVRRESPAHPRSPIMCVDVDARLRVYVFPRGGTCGAGYVRRTYKGGAARPPVRGAGLGGTRRDSAGRGC